MNKIITILVVLFFGLGVFALSTSAENPTQNGNIILMAKTLPHGDLAEIEKALKEEEFVRVIVWLKDNQFTSPEYQKDLDKTRVEIKKIQDRALFALSKDEFNLKYRYKVSNGFAGSVNKSGFEKLIRHPDVREIFLDREVYGSLAESRPLINADDVENTLGYTGQGITVCIVDSGVDYHNHALGGGFGPGFKVVGGFDFCNWFWCLGPGDSDPMDERGHGTHVAGIVASEDDTFRGVAPLANIAAVKVLNSSGNGTFSAITAGIDWCVDHAEAFNIKVITMSLGDSREWSPANCPGYSDSSLQRAYNAGIFIDAASGNETFTNGISYPACSPWVTSVGAVYDADVGSQNWGACVDQSTQADQIVCFTNRDSNLDLLAPGSVITSTASSRGTKCGAPGGTFGNCSGTSMAAPHVAGAAALLLEQNPCLRPNVMERILRYTGVQVDDLVTSLTFPRINVFAAAALADWSHDIRLTVDPSSSERASLVTDPFGNVHIVWHDDRDGNEEIYYTKLDNNGNTLVDDTRLTTSTRSWYPSLATDSNGNVHITWWYGGIYYKKLDNNGNTLVDDTQLTFGSGSYPSIAIDPSGNAHIAWFDDRDGTFEIYYTKLDNNGNTLVDDTRLTVTAAYSWFPSLAIDSSGQVHIAWEDDRDDDYGEIYYTKLDNNGNTLVDDTRLTFAPGDTSRWPSLATDVSGQIHIAWVDGRDLGPEEIYYTKLDNNGNTLVDDTRLTDTLGDSVYPSLATNSSGKIHIAWSQKDYRSGGWEIYYTKLDNNGNTLVDDTRLTFNSAESFHPSLTTDSFGNVHIAWYDGRDGNKEIYYKHDSAMNFPGCRKNRVE